MKNVTRFVRRNLPAITAATTFVVIAALTISAQKKQAEQYNEYVDMINAKLADGSATWTEDASGVVTVTW